ncbi:hypothetical protein CTAYLR_006776 [Chrysophaeum taylorii]|uniref:Aspartyl/asparaginy/proline hydroxylase domain-containing protein n=1 Tax=Chrysophaeum taylorii TaxID=2483200 RepID=A0AAD7XI50_9STRA|nr:hypothetical protein CTAYLR_006776 [Chrysophaeum taylorii]
MVTMLLAMRATSWVVLPEQRVSPGRSGSVRVRTWTTNPSDLVDDDEPIRFGVLESVEEQMWRRVRTEVYGGPDYAAPASLERFEEHCKLRRAAASDDWVHVDEGKRVVYADQQYPNLTARAIWDVASEPRFAWIRELEARTEDMRVEVLARSRTLHYKTWQDPNASAPESPTNSGWGMIHLHHHKPHLDRKCPRRLFPRCVSALRDVGAPIAPRYASVARQRAGRAIKTHTDRIPWMLTCHVPLFGPKRNAYLLVDGERCDWTPGKATVVDTTFHHSAHNDHQYDDMHLLHVDFFHPDLSRDECHALQVLHRHLGLAKTQRKRELKPVVSRLEAAFRAADASRDE